MSRRGLAFGCLLGGTALALIASGRPWWQAVGEGVVAKITGSEATGGLSQALAIVVLAGTLLILALRARGRRVVGTLLLLVGLGMALAGGLRRQPNPEAVRSQVPEVSLVDALNLSATVWPWVYALSGVLIAAGAAVTMITASRWPARSDRYQAQPSQGEAGASDDDSAELWKALDAGVDPTATDASVGNRAPPHGARLAHERQPQRAERAMDTEGAVLPPLASTTAADSPRDARAAERQTDDRKTRHHDTPTVTDPEVRDRRTGDTMDGTEPERQLPWSPRSQVPGKVQRGRGERRE
jgi:uncharacterized membrane protein (TIGR02234 family)